MAGRQLARRDSAGLIAVGRSARREMEVNDQAALVAHHELAVRLGYVQAQIMADTAVANTAMAAVAGSAGFAGVLGDASPEVVGALEMVQAKHLGAIGRRMDDFIRGS
jgi:hypothetical protein